MIQNNMEAISNPEEKTFIILLCYNKLHCCEGEFLNAVLHYKGKEAWEIMKEAIKRFPVLQLDITKVSLKTYIKDMYQEGRWA